ncbi:hypothetical protein MPH_12103 [Macrophomina phaseolina MS6]|uniref:Uncharacterized protein n=1 Tax=Macrophomina phaseolina (strain MS6) TaxID=1126212 RepID=K2RCZ6_MACPH|nr:hypothetical protein MPH_12103 [Macrophomina phaseolina MS6]
MSRIASPLMAGTNLTTEERESLIRETRGPMALGVIFSFWGLSVIAVSLRLFVRFKVIKKPGLDDWMIAVSEVWLIYSPPIALSLLTPGVGVLHGIDFLHIETEHSENEERIRCAPEKRQRGPRLHLDRHLHLRVRCGRAPHRHHLLLSPRAHATPLVFVSKKVESSQTGSGAPWDCWSTAAPLRRQQRAYCEARRIGTPKEQ